MISSRYAVPVALLLFVVAIPTLIHNYVGATSTDGRSLESIDEALIGYTSEPFKKHGADWVQEMFNSKDWIQRIYTDATGVRVRLFVARSYDHKSLYHHPELGLSHGSDLKSQGTILLSAQPEIPVHLLKNTKGTELVAYVLLHDDDFIQNPVSYQIGNALNLLFASRQPMTLFYVAQSNLRQGETFDKTPAAAILLESVRRFEASNSH